MQDTHIGLLYGVIMKFIYTISILLSTLIFSGCKKYTADTTLLSELLDSPSNAIIDTFNIQATSIKITREFNPPFTLNGKKLKCQFTLIDSTGGEIEDVITPLRMFIIKDDEVWETEFEEVQNLGEQIICYAENGPRWDTDIYVHLAIQIKDVDRTYIILDKHHKIIRLDD